MRECVGVRYCVVYFISVLLVFFHSVSVFCLVAVPSGKMLSHCVKLPLDLNLLCGGGGEVEHLHICIEYA